MSSKPTVIKDGVDFSKYNMPEAKEVDVVNSTINDYNYARRATMSRFARKLLTEGKSH